VIMSGQAKLEMAESNYISPKIQLPDFKHTPHKVFIWASGPT